MLFGWIGDRIPGRRTPFVLGLIVLAASTLCFALGSSLPVLLIARLLEGLSTAIVSTLGMALLNDVVGPEHIGKAMGYTSMALSSGLLLGPVLGGVLYEYGGYFQVFYPAFGLIVVEGILRLMVIEAKSSRGSTAVVQEADSSGSLPPKLSGSGQDCSSPDGGIQEAPSIECYPETEPLLAKLVVPRSAVPTLLCSPRFLTAILGGFILMSIGCGFDAVLAPYIKDEFDMKSTHAATLFLALALPMFLAPIAGSLTDRYGARLPVASGFAVAIPSLVLLKLVTGSTSKPFLKLIVLLVFIGICLAFASSPLSVEASKVVLALENDTPGVFGRHGAYAQAFGLMNTTSAAGGLVGPLYTGFVRVHFGWGAMSLSLSAICSVMLALVVIFSGRKPRPRTVETTEGRTLVRNEVVS